MATAFVETSQSVRLALRAGAFVLLLLLAALAVDLVAGGDLAPGWAVPAVAAAAAVSAVLRVATVERERRAWSPLAAGLVLYALGCLVRDAADPGAAHLASDV